ncbi:MAG: hypothetical protein II180_09250, partial [Proteobacteria bacterium]|nr:hypothetical protein [Pseudomonadota bacterium]
NLGLLTSPFKGKIEEEIDKHTTPEEIDKFAKQVNAEFRVCEGARLFHTPRVSRLCSAYGAQEPYMGRGYANVFGRVCR